jgi:hypothetical protein
MESIKAAIAKAGFVLCDGTVSGSCKIPHQNQKPRKVRKTPKRMRYPGPTVEQLDALIAELLPTMPQEAHLLNAGDTYNLPYETLPPTRFMRFSKRWRGQFIF